MGAEHTEGHHQERVRDHSATSAVDLSDLKDSVFWTWSRSAVRTPTISDEGSACEHFAEHELDDGQDDAHQAADDGHAEQESVLRETETRES